MSETSVDAIATIIVDSAIKVHKTLGPGLLESAYQKCLAIELKNRGVRVDCEVPFGFFYEGEKVDIGYRLDMVVEDLIIIENKTVDQIARIHEAQLITYLKLRNCHLGFILNWNVILMKDGIKRIAYHYQESPRAAGMNSK
jgi:GxxExxY protein